MVLNALQAPGNAAWLPPGMERSRILLGTVLSPSDVQSASIARVPAGKIVEQNQQQPAPPEIATLSQFVADTLWAVSIVFPIEIRLYSLTIVLMFNLARFGAAQRLFQIPFELNPIITFCYITNSSYSAKPSCLLSYRKRL